MNNFKFGTENKKDAMDEVRDMMAMELRDINATANAYLKFMAGKYGFCGEVMVTAFAHYCQAVLELPCEDEGYKITPEGKNWFIINDYLPQN
jgi:hypothetical protein